MDGRTVMTASADVVLKTAHIKSSRTLDVALEAIHFFQTERHCLLALNHALPARAVQRYSPNTKWVSTGNYLDNTLAPLESIFFFIK